MISLNEAYKIFDEHLHGISLPGEIVDIHMAQGRILLEDQVSLLDLPPFNKSAVDGYAVMSDDDRESYRLLGTVRAGDMPNEPLTPGAVMKVMTGAPVPEGTGKVIMVERTEESGGAVRILTPEKKSNLSQRGEDVHAGDVILRSSTRLGALEVANLISCGISQVKVARPLCVSIFSTGNEIVDSVDKITRGKIMDSNSPLLKGLCEMHGIEVVSMSSIPDDFDSTVTALRQALEQADMVLFSGGVSEGDYDFVTGALSEAGLEIHFNRVAVKPGKPITFASSDGKIVLGLPGNPVAVFLMFHLFVLRALKLMVGGKPDAREISLPLAKEYSRKKAERDEYVPCRITPEGTVALSEYHGSAHLLGLISSDGFILIPRDTTQLEAGERVRFMPIGGSQL